MCLCIHSSRYFIDENFLFTCYPFLGKQIDVNLCILRYCRSCIYANNLEIFLMLKLKPNAAYA